MYGWYYRSGGLAASVRSLMRGMRRVVFFSCVGGQRRGLGLLEFLSLGMGRAFKGGMARCGGGNNHALLGGSLDLWCSCWALRIAEGAKEL